MNKPAKHSLILAILLQVGTGFSAAAENTGDLKADGFIYGTVHTEGGRHHTGVLRWGDEEAFWDDLFNGTKAKLPHIDRLPKDRRKRKDLRIFGLRISYDWDEEATGRQFMARFGDLREILPRGGEKVDVKMKSGTILRLDGGSNDIGATIHVQDAEAGGVDIEWKKIERIVFQASPATLRPEVRRLYGKVTTADGVFRGFVQWDSQECLSTDKLDGDSEDGKMSLEMGRIRSIEKKGKNSSTIQMADGRKLDLRGTNDVDSSIRGIFVEDPRYGRVKIPWDEFRSVEFRGGQGTGRAYVDYRRGAPLRGAVTDVEGKTWKGRVVFDLDETESWEMLNGNRNGIEYDVPFEMVRSIEPRNSDSTTVMLRDGNELRLEESQDVTEANSGVLVFPDGGGSERYVPWDQVQRIEIE